MPDQKRLMQSIVGRGVSLVDS